MRWGELKLLEKLGEISNLERQVVFRFELNGVLICKYLADFVYFTKDKRVVEDRKNPYLRKKDGVYRIKNKMMKAFYGIDIYES